MTGQDAANIAKNFHDKLNATGAILTKLDGDTRGGVALSIKEVSNIPIKFSSSGEKMDSFEPFHPERMASRILGMGDVLTFIENVTDAIDEDEAKGLMEKMMNDKFNYYDLLKQFKMMKKMGSISRLLGFIPGLGNLKKITSQIDDKQFEKMTVIINSMTDAEKKDPSLIEKTSGRRQRVAKGAGVSVSDVNNLRQALETQKKMVKSMAGMSEEDMKRFEKNPEELMKKLPQNSHKSKGKGKGKGNFRF